MKSVLNVGFTSRWFSSDDELHSVVNEMVQIIKTECFHRNNEPGGTIQTGVNVTMFGNTIQNSGSLLAVGSQVCLRWEIGPLLVHSGGC